MLKSYISLEYKTIEKKKKKFQKQENKRLKLEAKNQKRIEAERKKSINNQIRKQINRKDLENRFKKAFAKGNRNIYLCKSNMDEYYRFDRAQGLVLESNMSKLKAEIKERHLKLEFKNLKIGLVGIMSISIIYIMNHQYIYL